MGLAKFSVRFYMYIIIIAIFILIIVGYFYFRTESAIVLIAWYIYAIIGGINLLGSILLAIYQGLDKIVEIQKNILLGSIINSVSTWLMLMLHFKIWALLTGTAISVIITLVLLYRSAPLLWKQMFHYKVYSKYNFLKETIPLQWRYAISFVCSYLLVYAYVPSTFKLIGSVEAGQLGLTLTIITVINGVANSWMVTKVPKFNVYVAQKKYLELNDMFRRSLTSGLLIQVLLSFFAIIFVFGLNYFFPAFGKRFLALPLIFWLLVSQIPQFFITGFSLYLRAFKKEPFMNLLVVNALLMVGSIYVLLYKQHSFNYFIYSISLVNLIILFCGLLIYKNKKRIYLSIGVQ
jgi:O-antigen/teichoic acid export membrane protein